MDSPRPGDVLIKRDPESGQFTLAEALTGEQMAGPFDRPEYAIGVAHSYAWVRAGSRVWGQRRDGTIELLCSTPDTKVHFLAEQASGSR
jgi:hypothetical protein